jgi:tRNA G18 (ribose-2'-O)-methylase SpoU
MEVYLYKVGRNLNRVYRTCEAFGIRRIYLMECDAELAGNLFRARGRVKVISAGHWPNGASSLALETSCKTPLWEVEWKTVEALLVGGETSGLPLRQVKASQTAFIPMTGKVSGLTVEAALAIALYERARHGYV